MSRFDSFFDNDVTAGPAVTPDAPTTQEVATNDTTAPASEPPASETTHTDTTAADNTENASESVTDVPDNSVISEDSDGSQNDTPAEESTGNTEQSPVVPSSLSGTAPDLTLKPRYDGDSVLGRMVADDWISVIESDPRSFDALLYRPDNGTSGVIAADGEGNSAFTDVDNNQREITYANPVLVKVRDSNDSRETFTALDNDTNQDGLVDDFLVLSIAEKDIPKGSIIEWNEEALDGSVHRVWWYVNQLYSYGTQHVGTLYYCIPARTFDKVVNGSFV